MLTFRARNVAVPMIFLFLAAACSREQQDWRSAEAADTVEGYSQFLERHPDSELATAARTRVAQLAEEREWKQASQADTAEAYRQFLAQHPNGKWSQEARIRIQNFALNGLPPPGTPMAEAPDAGAAGSNSPAAIAPPTGGPGASASIGSAAAPTSAGPPPSAAGATSAGASASGAVQSFAAPGELAQPAGSARAPAVALSTPYVSASNTPATNTAAYGIQLGAFTSAAAASNAWQQLTARFSAQLQGLSPQVVPANTATGTLFRLQAAVGDESRARQLCDLLKKQSQACVPVLPH